MDGWMGGWVDGVIKTPDDIMVMSFFKKNIIPIVFTFIGAVAGFLYWKFVGCKTGSCPIKSNWYLMVIYGVVFGYLVGDLIKSFINKRKKLQNQ